MELKEYQTLALDAFARWRDELSAARQQMAEAAQDADAALKLLSETRLDVEDVAKRNYPKLAWRRLALTGGVPESAGPYVDRTDEAGRPIPHVCFKVPTGGGKTLLAAAALERMNRQTGLVLWITPTNAIYEQTKASLKNREHPYRQMLERASGGRVKFMEKDDPFTLADAANYLCVMLLSLPAARRNRNREFLKMFRDSGRYSMFFPDSDDALGDGRLFQEYPDLDAESGPVKHSLLNVFKMLRPVVVLDEAHKAYGNANAEANREFVQAVNRLDPGLVIELSATPTRSISNLLVDVDGVDLKQEEMIKLPVNVTAYPDSDWQVTLSEASDHLERLEAEARSLENSEGRYIRPIAVVRVERTGNDQRDGERVHAEDVRDYLIRNLAVADNAVRVKSSAIDELGRENLLSEYSPVRWIITKNALMEGWDCPFAYVLVMLDNTQAQLAVTQLVGRVMRQPHARRTNREALDQCYVYCWDTHVATAVDQVKNGLEQEGLTGLEGAVFGASAEFRRVTVTRRERFQGKDIFLPLVLHKEGEQWVELDYQQHILPYLDWVSIDEPDPQGTFPDPAKRESATVDVGGIPTIWHGTQELHIDKTVNIAWFARQLSDLVPNAWQTARIASKLVERLRAAGEKDERIYDRRSYLANVLRDHVKGRVEAQAERVFRDKLRKGEIRFDLKAGKPAFQMKESYEISIADGYGLMDRNDGQTVQLSLFEPIYVQQFDTSLERSFARYLDEQKALQWWHRVAVRQQGDYYLRGWKQERIWPDFVALGGAKDGVPHVLVFETKGEHLRDSRDTDYKQRVLETLQEAFNCGTMTVREGPAKGTFRLVFNENEFPAALERLAGYYGA